MSLDTWRTLTIVVAATGQTAFVLLYMTFPWWRVFLGRALFLKAFAFATLLDVAVFGQALDWANEENTFVALYGLLAFGVWVQFLAFLRVRVQNRQARVVSGNVGSR